MSEVKLTKKDVRGSFLRWLFFSHSCYNYERLQANSFAQSMGYALKKLYPDDKEKLGQELEKHTVFFNTEPNVGCVIHGVTLAMEEQRANGAPIEPDVINGIKTGLMGPFAGIGDSITQGIITPVLLAIALGLSTNGSIIGPIFYLVTETAVMWAIAYSLWMYGYRMGTVAVEKILEGGLVNKLLKAAGILGCTVLGGLVSNFINITTSLQIKTTAGNFILQTALFDKIMPGLLSVSATLFVFWLVKKGVSPNKIILGLFVAGVLLNLLGILGSVPVAS